MRRVHVFFFVSSTVCGIFFTTLLMQQDFTVEDSWPVDAETTETPNSKPLGKRAVGQQPTATINWTQLSLFLDDLKKCQERPGQVMQALKYSRPITELLLGTRSPVLCLAMFSVNNYEDYNFDVFLTRQPQWEIASGLAASYFVRPMVLYHLCSPFIDSEVTANYSETMVAGCNCAAYTRSNSTPSLMQSVNVATDWNCCCLPRALKTEVKKKRNIGAFSKLGDFLDELQDTGMKPPFALYHLNKRV